MMYSDSQIKTIRKHPYIYSIGLTYTEFVSFLSGYGIDEMDSKEIIKRMGVRIANMKKLFPEFGILSGLKGGITAIHNSKEYIYGLQPQARIEFELLKVQEEYDKLVKEGKLSDIYYSRKGGLNKTNSVRVISTIYKKGGEISLSLLSKELEFDSVHFRERVIKPLQKRKQIEIIANGIGSEKVILSQKTKYIWNKKNLKSWVNLLSTDLYKPILFLHARDLQLNNN